MDTLASGARLGNCQNAWCRARGRTRTKTTPIAQSKKGSIPKNREVNLGGRLHLGLLIGAVIAARRAPPGVAQQRLSGLLPNDLHQHPLAPPPIEFTVENLLPRTKVEFSIGHGHHRFPAHDLPLHVSVGVVLASIVVALLVNGRVGCQLLQPLGVILVQTALIVIDENGGGDVQGIDQHQSLLDAAFSYRAGHLGRDVHEPHPFWNLNRQFLAVAFHGCAL